MRKYLLLLCPLLLFAEDKPIDTIDVSAYPAALQESYKVFQVNCSQCHGLEDPIGYQRVLPSSWVDLVDEMKGKSKKRISDKNAALITEFLIYDSAVRRKSEFDEAMKNLDESDRKKEQSLLDSVLKKYPS